MGKKGQRESVKNQVKGAVLSREAKRARAVTSSLNVLCGGSSFDTSSPNRLA